MKSLIPNSKREVDGLSVHLAEIFQSEIYSKSVSRVVNYLVPIYLEFSDPGPEKIFRINNITEQYFLPMPTVDAYNAEISLCEGIVFHSSGLISDEDVKVPLKKYLDTHIFVFSPDSKGQVTTREVKAGDFSNWTKSVQLYYLSGKNLGATVNAVQAWLLYLIALKQGVTNLKCVQL